MWFMSLDERKRIRKGILENRYDLLHCSERWKIEDMEDTVTIPIWKKNNVEGKA